MIPGARDYFTRSPTPRNGPMTHGGPEPPELGEKEENARPRGPKTLKSHVLVAGSPGVSRREETSVPVHGLSDRKPVTEP